MVRRPKRTARANSASGSQEIIILLHSVSRRVFCILLKLRLTTAQQPRIASIRHLQRCNALIELKRVMLRSIDSTPSEDLKKTSNITQRVHDFDTFRAT